MRKHDVRKWLHAVLDLLPVILIPVFMIYSHRHTIDSGSIQVPQNEVVDFNQIFNFNQNFSYDNGILNVDSLSFHFEYESNNNENDKLVYVNSGADNLNDIYLVKFEYISNINFRFQGVYQSEELVSNNSYSLYQSRGGLLSGYSSFYWYNYDNISTSWVLDVRYIQTFNLTQMFGSGNEPTIQQFNQWYPNDYYDYTLSHKELLKNTSTITYDDTDIMSQATYQLYNSVDKYFNMGNVFNLGGIYDWFNLNIFNGNAPISIFIVWNVVLYEFVMDLLFLLYGLFMWFIDMVEKLMEKPINSVR